MPTPSMLSNAPTTHNWVSSIIGTGALLKPEIDPVLYRRYGDQNMLGLIDMYGGKNPVSSLLYTHFEDDFLHSIVKVNAAGAGGAGATASLTVQTAPTVYNYVFPPTATNQPPYIVPSVANPTVGQAQVNPLRLNDIVLFPSGIQAEVTAINYAAGTFDVTPTITGEAIPAVTTSTEIAIIGNAHGEQTGQPVSRNSRVIQYQNNMQIFKGNHTTSGSAMGEQLWVEVTNQNGETARLWYYEGQLREHKRMLNEMEIYMVTGKKITNETLSVLQPTTISTEGLIPFMENNGNTTTYSLITGIQRTDFETMIATQLDKNRGAKENTLWCGINLRQSIDRFVGNEMKQGAITYGMFEGNKQKAIDFGFDSFTLTGYTFHMKTYDVFNYPQMLGASGQPYVNMGLVIPAEKTVESIGPNKTRTSVPSVRMNYVSQANAGGSYSREMEEFLLGGVNGVFTTGTDELSYNLRAHRGLECFAGNRFVKIINS